YLGSPWMGSPWMGSSWTRIFSSTYSYPLDLTGAEPLPLDPLVIRALRKEDFLDLTFELVNLHADGEPPRLARSDANKPALLIVHFPPQHIVEEAFGETEAVPGSAPVRAVLAGPSRLVFELPDHQGDWPLTLETLLNWPAYTPVLAPNALLPPDATSGPGLDAPTAEQTALEIPTGLYLSPDESGAWVHEIPPVEHDGRFELWHTRLGAREAGGDGAIREDLPRYARVIWALGSLMLDGNSAIPFNSSLTPEDRTDIARLTSDFSLPEVPSRFADDPRLIGLWRLRHLPERGLPRRYTPRPVRARRLMLSAAGAWVNLESAWDYPTIIPGQNSDLGYPKLALEQWQHIATQGRDNFVKTVQTAFLCDVGHRVSIVTITEREFVERPPQGPDGTWGATAFLRQYRYIEVQEPLKDYRALGPAFLNEGRELPFKRIRITTPSTPNLEPVADNQPFWPTPVGGNATFSPNPFPFQMVAEDWEGRIVTFERPLLCVPLRGVNNEADWQTIVESFNAAGKLAHRTTQIWSQPVAFAKTTPGDRGKTTLNTETVEFQAQVVQGGNIGALPPSHPLFLPTVKSARVGMPSVERLLGRPSPVDIQFDTDYLSQGMDPDANKGEVFAELVNELDLPFAAEKAGGLIKPDTTIRAVSRSLGPVSNPTTIKQGSFDTSMFEKARFLGGITLKDILKEKTNFDPASIKEADRPVDRPVEEWQEWQERLNDPAFKLEVPMLTSRLLYPPDVDDPPDSEARPTAAETHFLWKPALKDEYKLGIFALETPQGIGFPKPAQLILQARMVTPLDGKASTFEIDGRLTDFALYFAKAMRLKFSSLSFRTESGKKIDVSADGMDLTFEGPLKFVNTLKDLMPDDGFSDPPYLDITASGVRAGYTLGIPSFGVGIFSIQNIGLSAGLSLPFVDQPAGVRFAVSERHNPFLVTVALFGGGGFFAIALNARGIEQIEAAIEFGGNLSLNIGVASGGMYVMAGIYFCMTGDDVKLTGYLRCGGYLEVLGLISISVEFYLGFTYRSKGEDKGEVWGQASVAVCVKIAFFSKVVILPFERKFAGAAGDPTFEELVDPDDWKAYCAAFA
ncbi:MAG: hypothetical protein AVDCRST_MAG93-2292, partial [uncultured Chloroflexia bacterium]